MTSHQKDNLLAGAAHQWKDEFCGHCAYKVKEADPNITLQARVDMFRCRYNPPANTVMMGRNGQGGMSIAYPLVAATMGACSHFEREPSIVS